MSELFQVEEMESIMFDEHGIEDGIWKGYSVTKIDDPVNYCFDCRDKENADNLCNFLNNECIIDNDESIDAFVMDNLTEWTNLITELSFKEIQFHNLKEKIFTKEQDIIKNTNFNDLYGANNKDVRKAHLDKEMAEDYEEKLDLEWRMDYVKRRISFLKQLIHTKTVLMEVKG